jgi:hypothetical protein
MPWLNHIFRRKQFDDLSAEMRAHLEERADELVAEGLPRREAELQARREFGIRLALGAKPGTSSPAWRGKPCSR